MKKKDFLWSLLAIVMAATLSVGLSSCKKHDPELSVSTTSITLQANGDVDGGETKDITVSASHTDWTASVTEGSAWLHVNRNGQKATVSADPNTTTAKRTGKIKISATEDASLSYDVSVSQTGADGTITVSASTFDFEAEGGSQTVTVTSNTGWNASSSQGWLTVSPSANQVSGTTSATLTAGDNKTNNDRTCTVTFTTADGKATAAITITQKKQAPYILVNGLENTSLKFEGGFNGKSGVDYKQSVTITSNVSWNASDIPSWLSVSPTNGNGNVTMTLYPTSENSSSSSRSATIRLAGSGATASIEVSQGSVLTTAKVTPSNLVALYNQIGWDLMESGTVNKFHWLCISEREMNRMTDNELLEALLKEESKKFVDNYMFFPAYDSNGNRIAQNTTYYICTVAFDVNDKRGEVVKSKVTTPAYANSDNDAWVSFPSDEMLYGSSGFQFTAVKEGFCDTYHVIYGNLPSDYTYPAVAFAFEINYYKKNKKKHWFAENWGLEISTNYPNTHTFTYSTSTLTYYPLISIWAWGVFKNGTESSDMTGGQWDVSSNAPKRVSRSTAPAKNIVISRSTEEARARKHRK